MTDRVLRGVLRLHPAKYRREWGEEIAAVFADTTAGAGRWATARELFDLAGHGVRARLGLSSSGTLARLAAMAAPFAAGAAAGSPLLEFYALARDWLRHGSQALWVPSATPYYYAYWIDLMGHVLLVAAVVAAACGRWTLARPAAPLGAAAVTAAWILREYPILLGHHGGWWLSEVLTVVAFVGAQVLWALTVVAAPPDLLGPATRRGGLAAFAGVLVGGLAMGGMFGGGPFRTLARYGVGEVLFLGTCVAALVLLLVALPALRRGRFGPAAGALALVPIGTPVLIGLLHYLWRTDHSAFVAVLGLAAMGAVVVSRRRPAMVERRPPTVG